MGKIQKNIPDASRALFYEGSRLRNVDVVGTVFRMRLLDIQHIGDEIADGRCELVRLIALNRMPRAGDRHQATIRKARRVRLGIGV